MIPLQFHMLPVTRNHRTVVFLYFLSHLWLCLWLEGDVKGVILPKHKNVYLCYDATFVTPRSWDSSVYIATRLWAEWPRFNSWQGLRILLLVTASRLALGPTKLPIQCVLQVLSLGVKRPKHDADHSLPFSAEVKEWVELHLHSPNMRSWRRA
jgi:hypothetical protein